ncbi:alkaline phosphatase family protein [Dyadobacter sp. LJ53]|uniref:alkaline phosphatase family protein n=1 Tax=Dyadobacter chenwenxiniae TaxID=2906456 RepID=UPI001F3CFBF5|nr:alkaline phosphatase family protein [Dyadobacter chenwenxiniae]MCF0052458.1 alkaline phosphatase family protein [Dyadobacter chenwenxiniae]
MILQTKIALRAVLLIWAALAASTGFAQKPKIEMPERGLCAHRGCMDTHPENTLPAFKEAVRLGAQMIEFDIQLTKDGEMVIMHDDGVDRTTNGSGKVSDLTFAQIRALDAGIKKSEKFTGTQVPTFEETLAMMPENVWLNCHLKGDEEVGAKSAALLAKSNRLHQAFLTCSEKAANAARLAVPEILICNGENSYRKNTPKYVQATVGNKANFIQLLRHEPGEDRTASMKLLKDNKIKINYFYAKTPDELEKLYAEGVDFVLVNNVADFLPAAKKAGIEPVVPTYSKAKNPAQKQAGANAANERNKTLIVFFDGLRPDYITAEQMPNLFVFSQKASHGKQHHSVFPTVTRVNSSSYATGSYPGTHGLLGNSIYFPKVSPNKAIGTTYEDLIKVQESESGKLLTGISLGEALENAGEKMMVFSSGTTGQAFLQNHKIGKGAIINHELILPESFKEQVFSEIGPMPKGTGDVFIKHKWVTDALLHYGLKNDGPLVSAIWMSDPDGAAHRYGIGSDQAVAAIKYVDAQFGRILDSLASRGLREKYNILISTDHGFVTHTGKQNLSDLLISEGLKKDKESDDVVIAEGAIYVKNHDQTVIRKIVETLHKTDWIGAVFTKPKKKGNMTGSVKGTLSFDAIHYNHPTRTGDILVAPNWNDDKNDKGYAGTDLSGGVAGHGGSSPYEINIALFTDGPDFRDAVKSELPTSNVDIAPTILALYSLQIPPQMDGRALSEFIDDQKSPSEKSGKVTIETKASYPWGTYNLSLELSVLGKYKYINFTKTDRVKTSSSK